MSEPEDDSSICKMTRKRLWSNLPHDMLSEIANWLGLFEFLSFRDVCKDWRDATSKAFEDTFSGYDPWFLLYGGKGSSQCSLLSNDDKVHTINIPEMDGTTCLASYEGWLLLFRSGSLFFLCPFSGAKIELPNFPSTRLTHHFAAFSSVPTSQDCVVVVFNRNSDYELELHMLCRGDNIWATLNATTKQWITKGSYHCYKEMITLAINSIRCFFCVMELLSYNPEVKRSQGKRDRYRLTEVKRKLGLNANVPISTCGTLIPHTSDEGHIVIESRRIWTAMVSESPCLKGVWIRPRYHKHSNERW